MQDQHVTKMKVRTLWVLSRLKTVLQLNDWLAINYVIILTTHCRHYIGTVSQVTRMLTNRFVLDWFTQNYPRSLRSWWHARSDCSAKYHNISYRNY